MSHETIYMNLSSLVLSLHTKSHNSYEEFELQDAKAQNLYVKFRFQEIL